MTVLANRRVGVQHFGHGRRPLQRVTGLRHARTVTGWCEHRGMTTDRSMDNPAHLNLDEAEPPEPSGDPDLDAVRNMTLDELEVAADGEGRRADLARALVRSSITDAMQGFSGFFKDVAPAQTKFMTGLGRTTGFVNQMNAGAGIAEYLRKSDPVKLDSAVARLGSYRPDAADVQLPHYAATTAAAAERMVDNQTALVELQQAALLLQREASAAAAKDARLTRRIAWGSLVCAAIAAVASVIVIF